MLKIRDKRKPLTAAAAPVRRGDLFHVRKGSTVAPHASCRMIALVTFAAGGGLVKRWSTFMERPQAAARRIEKRQAMEDLTAIEGIDLAAARALGRGQIATFDSLRTLPEAVPGLTDDAWEAVQAWQESFAPVPDEEPEESDLATLKGVGTSSLEKLELAGIGSLADLDAVPDQALDGLGLSAVAIKALRNKKAARAEAGAS